MILDNCMYGEDYRHRQALLTNAPWVMNLSRDCDRTHSHALLGMALAHLGTELDRDIHAIHWLTLEEIEALDRDGRLRSPLVLKRIRDALAGKTFPMDVLHER